MSPDILSFIIFLPAVVAFGLMLTTRDVNTIRNIAFLTTTVILALVLKIYIEFDSKCRNAVCDKCSLD